VRRRPDRSRKRSLAGQISGGVAQGIGTALYEEMTCSDDAKPRGATLAADLLPGSEEVPPSSRSRSAASRQTWTVVRRVVMARGSGSVA
jgi:CO/xanthine dehydrogenase Mo-binding subunit